MATKVSSNKKQPTDETNVKIVFLKMRDLEDPVQNDLCVFTDSSAEPAPKRQKCEEATDRTS